MWCDGTRSIWVDQGRQALAAGITEGAIEARLRSGRWERRRQSVYLIGPVPSSLSQERMALCLSLGDDAAVAGMAAADEWRFDGCRSSAVEAVCPRRYTNRDPRVRVRYSASLRPHHLSSLRGLPIITPIQTLIMIADELTLAELEFPFEDVLRRGLVKPRELEWHVRHASLRRTRGVSKLRALMKDDGPRLASALEIIVRQAVRPRSATGAGAAARDQRHER